MGREIIGECSTSGEDPESESHELELAVKYIKQECGEPPRGADVQICWEDHELGSYPVIAVIWDDYETGYPEDYIQKCIEAFERFELPEEIYQRHQERFALLKDLRAIFDRIDQHLQNRHADKSRSKL